MLTFVHISDTHIAPDDRVNVPYTQAKPIAGARALVNAINALPMQVDCVIHTGDVAYDPEEGFYDDVREIFGALRMPIYYIAGNHDHRTTLQTALMRRDDLQPYPHYELELNGVQVVFMDSNAPAPLPAGSVSDDQLDWLDGICSANDERPLVIAVHHNVVPCGVPWLDNWMRMENGDVFHSIVRQARDRLQGVFHGHIHQNLEVLRDGVLYSAAASSWCQFLGYPTPENTDVLPDSSAQAGFSVIHIAETGMTLRRHFFKV